MFVCAYETTSITWNETVIVFAFPKCLFRSDCPVASGECPVFPACSGGSKPHNPCELVNYPNDLHFDNPFALPSVRSSNSAPGKAFNVILLAFDDMVMNACGCRMKPFLITCYHHQSLEYIYASQSSLKEAFLPLNSQWLTSDTRLWIEVVLPDVLSNSLGTHSLPSQANENEGLPNWPLSSTTGHYIPPLAIAIHQILHTFNEL